MRKSKLVVAIGATLAVAAAPLLTATTASAASGSNAPSVTRGAAASVSASIPACTQINNPSDYGTTKLVDLSGISDFTPVDKVGRVKFSPTLEKRSVPGSWGTWGSPPDTETDTPNILYTVGATEITVTLPRRGSKAVAGMEVEPNPFEVHNFTAVYKKRSGAAICTINRDADGNFGARVLAAKVKRAKTITVSSDVDFAIAAVRYR
jgi:hypothetical protein